VAVLSQSSQEDGVMCLLTNLREMTLVTRRERKENSKWNMYRIPSYNKNLEIQ
jgi:hypothetical protein